MGQAKRRGTYTQRRQAAIARDNPTASANKLNELYRHQEYDHLHRPVRRNPKLALAVIASMFVGLNIPSNRGYLL